MKPPRELLVGAMDVPIQTGIRRESVHIVDEKISIEVRMGMLRRDWLYSFNTLTGEKYERSMGRNNRSDRRRNY